MGKYDNRGVYNTWEVHDMRDWYQEVDYWKARARRDGQCYTVLTPVQRERLERDRLRGGT